MVVIHVVGVPQEAAEGIIARVACSVDCAVDPTASPRAILPPLVAFGLMQHEGKMSVVHGGMKKAVTFSHPIRNKEELLIVTGKNVCRGRQDIDGKRKVWEIKVET